MEAACNVDGVPHLPRPFLDKLTLTELEGFYDQYVTVIRQANPKFESLTSDEIVQMIVAVKKNEKTSTDFFTWQLAAIGKFYLENILPKDNEAGS